MKPLDKPLTTPGGEVREDLTNAALDVMFAKAVPFASLPASLQTKLHSPGRWLPSVRLESHP